jgi:hypothetical protein
LQAAFVKHRLQIAKNNPFGKFSAAILFKDGALKLKLSLNSIQTSLNRKYPKSINFFLSCHGTRRKYKILSRQVKTEPSLVPGMKDDTTLLAADSLNMLNVLS